MKPQPLKDKALKSIHDTIDCDIYKDKDIRSAVNWAINAACKPNLRISHSDFKEIMNEAFEDVIKE